MASSKKDHTTHNLRRRKKNSETSTTPNNTTNLSFALHTPISHTDSKQAQETIPSRKRKQANKQTRHAVPAFHGPRTPASASRNLTTNDDDIASNLISFHFTSRFFPWIANNLYHLIWSDSRLILVEELNLLVFRPKGFNRNRGFLNKHEIAKRSGPTCPLGIWVWY